MRIDRAELFPDERAPASELLRELYAFSAVFIFAIGFGALLFGVRM